MRELSLNNCRLDQRYDILEQLGRGSYAEIYLAQDILASPQSPRREVVIKALNVFLQDDLDTELERTLVENFQNEAVALDRVRHPNIISRIGHGTARDLAGTVFHYIVLEYLPGGDLQKLVRGGKLPLAQALGYTEQICAGLGHAHGRGIIHRDIKPHNLILTADRSTVKIADFGVARFSQSDSPITRVGTNIYAPPEHSPMFAGQTGTLAFAALSPAADIYSLAKSLYTLVTGEAPRSYTNKALAGLPESLRDEEWADDLDRVLRRATLQDPRERPQSVEEFWSDLEPVRRFVNVNGPPTIAQPSPITGPFSFPQPHVARGYTPDAPALPRFEALSDPQADIRGAFINSGPAIGQPINITKPANSTPGNLDLTAQRSLNPNGSKVIVVPRLKRRNTVRRFAAFLVFVGIFTGILYGTASYMRGRGGLPAILSRFAVQTAVANTDIYLRPSPNTDNDPVGLVTKNSKLRIVNSQNNWYQVDVIEQGRVRSGPLSGTRGWLNGKYIEIDGN